ncbi:MAG: DUF4129 domain-containing protein [Acidimicrobiales bacterium]
MPGSPGQTDPETARETADEVLGRPEFQSQKGLLGRFIDWLSDLLDFSPPETDPGPSGSLDPGPLGSIIGWLLVAVLLGLAVFLMVRFVRLRRNRRPPADAVPDVEVEEDGRPAAVGLGDPDTLEAAGRWREAMLARYRGLVGSLVESGVLAPVPGRTTGEYSDDVAEVLPEVAVPFDDATELFERAWYGDLPTGPGESARFQDAAHRVLAGSER